MEIMSENDNDELESTTEPTEEVEKTEEVEGTTTEVETEDSEALKEKNKKLFERAKKAEAEAKEWKAKAKQPEAKSTPSSEKQDDFTLEDVAVLVSKVTEKEDRETVKKYAKAEGVTLEEALGNDIVKGILKDRAEKRQTAEATNTGNARRGSTKLTSEQVITNAAKGKLPDDPADLVAAEMDAKYNKK
jgi:hypothetical protein